MKLHTPARIAAVAVLGTLALAACGSDNNNSGSSAGGSGGNAPAYCASGTLNASGSTAQANAMTEWIKDYQTACNGATVNYNGVGSGQGVTDFINGQTSFAGSDSALDPKKGEPDKANARCKTGNAVEPADGPRADRRGLQRRRCGQPGLQPPGPGQDLQRQDHQVERRRRSPR